jgi:predicted TIM-barrel fold metal-dependent hydrolase
MTAPLPVDTHAHVFTRALAFTAQRRYTPAYDASPEDFRAVLDRHGVGEAVLVQPSFLGTDNSFLLAAIAASGGRLRGIAVVDPAVTDRELDALAAGGVVGIRYNLVGADAGMIARTDYATLSRRVAARGWQIELHADGHQLPGLIDLLLPLATPVVIDHFGRPDPARGHDDPGFRRLLAAGPHAHLFVKISGSYRCGGRGAEYARTLLDTLGPARLLWGSDWPFTQFEDRRRYADGVAELQAWCSETERAEIAAASRRLFSFLPRACGRRLTRPTSRTAP